MGPGNLIGAHDWRAGSGRDEGHALAHLRGGRNVVEPRHRPRGLAEGRVPGDVIDALAVDEHLPSVVERSEIVGAGSHDVMPLLVAQDFTLFAISSTSSCGVTGVCAMRTPKGCSASSTAETTAAAVGMVETS